MKRSSKGSDHLAAIAEGADQLNEDDLVVQELPEGQLANCNPGNLEKNQKNSSFFRLTVSVDTQPPFGQRYVIFFGVVLTLYYDYMCSEMNFTPEKSFSYNHTNSQLLLTVAAALSQKGQIVV